MCRPLRSRQSPPYWWNRRLNQMCRPLRSRQSPPYWWNRRLNQMCRPLRSRQSPSYWLNRRLNQMCRPLRSRQSPSYWLNCWLGYWLSPPRTAAGRQAAQKRKGRYGCDKSFHRSFLYASVVLFVATKKPPVVPKSSGKSRPQDRIWGQGACGRGATDRLISPGIRVAVPCYQAPLSRCRQRPAGQCQGLPPGRQGSVPQRRSVPQSRR